MNTTPETLVVIQADRDAAVEYQSNAPVALNPEFADEILAGEHDHHWRVQRFAAHRLATLSSKGRGEASVDVAPPAVLAKPTDDDRRTAVAIMLAVNPNKPDPAVVARLVAAYRQACVEAALAHPTPEPCSPVAREGERSRGFMDGLDHIAHFINALDSGDMTAKQVRTAIYSECLTARSAQTPPALSGGGELREGAKVAEEAMRAFCDTHGPSGGAWNISMVLDALATAFAAQDAALAQSTPAVGEGWREALAELRLWRSLVVEGGVPRYTVVPGAALNTVVTSTDSLLRNAERLAAQSAPAAVEGSVT